METVRSFVAIELPETLKRALAALVARLKAAGSWPVKWVEPEGVHLTLKFLGNIEAGRVGEIVGALELAAAGVPPFRLMVGELGVFPNVRRCQVAWVGLEGDLDTLGNLQQRIETNLSQLGFPRENRSFTPHLTLARVRDRALPGERQQFGEVFVKASLDTDCVIEVDSINLMKSQLTRAGAIYSRLGAIKLKSGE